MKHRCHALKCKAPCPPRWLMCKKHWNMVPKKIQVEVYETVGLRGPRVDATWAPWWRAQAKAIGFVANKEEPNKELYEKYLKRANDFADGLEKK